MERFEDGRRGQEKGVTGGTDEGAAICSSKETQTEVR